MQQLLYIANINKKACISWFHDSGPQGLGLAILFTNETAKLHIPHRSDDQMEGMILSDILVTRKTTPMKYIPMI